ncbi:MAG: T9SS type A sorting domain-containing protein, partial [Salinivirgaceae bacterium]
PQQVAISVYPNPGTEQITIDPGRFTGVFTMYNLHGKIMVSQQLHERSSIHTTDLAPGIYFYRFVNSKGEIASGKWVKK